MKLSLPPKLAEKLVWVPVISFCKISFPVYAFDALLCRNWPSSLPNSLTLQITLVPGGNIWYLLGLKNHLLLAISLESKV
jgi:hypothetical protein